MAIFAGIRKSLPVIGIIPFNHPNGSLIAIIQRIVVIAFIGYGGATVLWFIAFEAVTYDEITKAYSSVDIDLYGLSAFIILLIQRDSLLRLLDDLDAKMNERELEITN